MAFKDKDGEITTTGAVSITSMVVIFILGVIVLGMWGCPTYNVYQSKMAGEAMLAHAQSSKEVAVAEAKAKMESATYEAQADTIRAHGIAMSNQIIGKSLENNPAYLQWLWIDNITKTQNQVIYVPSGNMGMPVLEATRLTKPIATPQQ